MVASLVGVMIVYSVVYKFLKDESGTTAIEYAVIGTIISLALLSGSSTIGPALNNTFSDTAASFGG